MTQRTSPAPRFDRTQDAADGAPSLPQHRPPRLASALSGGLVLAMSCYILGELRLEGSGLAVAMLVGFCAGTLLGALRWNWIPWCIGLGVVLLIGAVAFTSLVPNLIAAPEPADALASADAVVALGSGVHTDGTPDATAQDRVLHAIQMVRLGYTHRIVLCGVLYTPHLRDMVRDLGNDCQVLQTGPVYNTHDEALAIAQMARDSKWSKIILVTEAWHMPRAAAVFRSAGVNVLRSPCAESRYDLHDPVLLHDRLEALKDWIHEEVGIRVYRARGWIAAGGAAPQSQ